MNTIERSDIATQTIESIAQALQVQNPKKRVMEAAEILYAEQCSKNRDIAVSDGQFYYWNDSYWKHQEHGDVLRHALDWLRDNCRQRATAEAAKGCAKTAALMVSKLPPRSEQIIIPTERAWFTLDDGEWWVAQPDSRIGLCHQVTLNHQPGPGLYMPAPVSDDSLFGRYLRTSLPDPAVREFVQEYVGYTLSNLNYQVAQLWIGSGSNGKSVLLNIVRALHAKAVAMRLDRLEGFDLAGIVGASLAICDETPKAKINQQAFKSLVSMGAVEINQKFRETFTYTPMAKWIICGNHMPGIEDHSEGWWRRVQIVDWNVQVKGKDIIPDLDGRIIREELHIVLDWALAGLQKLVARGRFAVPETVEKAKRDAKHDVNTVASWIWSTGAVLDDCARTMKQALYESYREHCEQKGFHSCNESQFFKRLKSELPGLKNERITNGSGTARRRAWAVNVAVGRFDDEPVGESQSEELDDDPFAVKP